MTIGSTVVSIVAQRLTNQITAGVFILLGAAGAWGQSSDWSVCPGDFNGDSKVAINELITAVNNSLEGCPPAGARFVDNRDGTITDKQTGLMWEKKVKLDGIPEGIPEGANLHDADDNYPWSGNCSGPSGKYCQPTAAASTLCTAYAEGTTGCAQCTGGEGTCNVTDTIWTWAAALNSTGFAGHTDWRIPRRAELESIRELSDDTPPVVNVAFQGASCGAGCTDITDATCSCTDSSYSYWSASTDAPFPDDAWVVSFYRGEVRTEIRNIFNNDVRAVRGAN